MKHVKKRLLGFLAIVMMIGSFQEVRTMEMQSGEEYLKDIKNYLIKPLIEESSWSSFSYAEKMGACLEKKLAYWQSEQGIENFVDEIGGFCGALSSAWCFYLLINYLSRQQEVAYDWMTIYKPGEIALKLKDVAGLSGAKADMQDIITYLENSSMYTAIGAHVPKGVLMNGGPGNGKTLLAKAVAGEVNCAFISMSGSSFVAMYVGRGALRVRILFEEAKKLSEEYGACIIFIDEIDAVGLRRSNGGGGGDREHDQTLMQLLQCMDGLDGTSNPIIVLGATNRAELLDPAFVRPGRFDRRVEITKPAFKDRIELIQISLKKIVSSPDVDVNRIARATGSFSGADLANLMNEAAIVAANDGRDAVEMKDIDLAFDNITLGREVKGMELTDADRWTTAVHEAGHAAGWLFGESKLYAVHKASITPRTGTLGVVHAVQLHESGAFTDSEMKAMIVVTLCGGLSEEAFDFDPSTGRSSDLAQARAIAYDMVVKYGMSEKLSYLSYDEIDHRLPNDIATEIHKEVQKIVEECRGVAQNLIASHTKEIEMIAKLLMEKGTVVGNEIYELLSLPLPKGLEFSLAS